MRLHLDKLLVRPAPIAGTAWSESLTSWLFRLALANGFTTYGELLQNEGIPLASRALIDVDPERWVLLSRLEQLSGIPPELLRSHALDRALTAMTGTPGGTAGRWLMSSGGHGCRYSICAACLAEDGKPHWRRAWRLTVTTVCPVHMRLLVDTCRCCGSELILSGLRTASLKLCEHCGCALHADPDPVRVRRISEWRLIDPQDAPQSVLPVRVVHSKLWWDGVRVLLNVLGRPRLAAKLQKAGLPRPLVPILARMATGPRLSFDRQSAAVRHQMLDLMDWLTRDWPARFISRMNDASITCGEYATAGIPVPYWLWSVCKENLERKRYRTTLAEVSCAAALLREVHRPVSKLAIKRLLGVTEGKALDALHPVMTRRLSDTEMLAVAKLLNADLEAASSAREQRASLLRDACSIAAAAWLRISLKAVSGLALEDGQALLQEWRDVARIDGACGRLARTYLVWMELYLRGTRMRFERYDLPQRALFLSRFGVPTLGFGLAARFADLLRRSGVFEWRLGSRLLTAALPEQTLRFDHQVRSSCSGGPTQGKERLFNSGVEAKSAHCENSVLVQAHICEDQRSKPMDRSGSI
ncbi:TniQ family protein [Neorhizobium sp. SHOUNA12B]|uniref:TniQ family protein n=1 Tax=Neorhizobium sp. SHOUNA12B TaxID=2908928 RepID=UPI0025F10E41|nr:TniQ family protein [Neorhizobium sp. SHOUNA12B]MCJ9671445.1 TniQ family protein [Neorhizobium sp. SHOUNA12B]